METIKQMGKEVKDPSNVNRALGRDDYQIITTEELLPDLAKAKILSVLKPKADIGTCYWIQKAAVAPYSGH